MLIYIYSMQKYICECKRGYYGNNCGRYDPCTSVPCGQYGTCRNISDTLFKCKCSDGYYGVRCNRLLNYIIT